MLNPELAVTGRVMDIVALLPDCVIGPFASIVPRCPAFVHHFQPVCRIHCEVMHVHDLRAPGSIRRFEGVFRANLEQSDILIGGEPALSENVDGLLAHLGAGRLI
ncbi:hypothetical protein IV498_02090 [Paenarthrobacter sp. Z7-10]|uniref:hypothetical protein n=1 Tax=Paenarthrobacter sp. Z7-10 TaxID=2787635 RepID=UPI0022A98F1C|nr:hypothetical protein [Paenarthrobacter sp. Z7-10]MCZ2402005.1 hypothetical protein [Paenarthrobacter sp. Z7-10]